ncbi:hypothetical protein [Streptococcus cuniculi]|uniref:Flagellar FliJ protein n=1 Tax=Streptococcus cuniculi TaxID=1432788 RepID=A0A4Y9JBZ2_9STRE|nr:hypothetical protein [Streptococcus cuniculi]MBF0777465.1 hypothetical protein [Streptococcus cuniculi]TFU98520.1 hypothetical protein E4T82_01765 [Streptococcus cuniculi]
MAEYEWIKKIRDNETLLEESYLTFQSERVRIENQICQLSTKKNQLLQLLDSRQDIVRRYLYSHDRDMTEEFQKLKDMFQQYFNYSDEVYYIERKRLDYEYEKLEEDYQRTKYKIEEKIAEAYREKKKSGG